MTTTADAPANRIAAAHDDARELRRQLTNLRGLLALSMVMTARERPAEIVHLATTAVPALVPARVLGAHLTFGDGARWHALTEPLDQPAVRADVLSQLQHLPGAGGPIRIAGHAWSWALGLLSPTETIGTLIVTAHEQPGEDDLLLLRSLAQQTGIALENARLHATQRQTNATLTATIDTLRHKTAIHDHFTQVAVAGGGHQGVVDALFELTGMPAVVEDRAGRILASAAPEGFVVRRASFARREQVFTSAAAARHPVRIDDRLLTVVRPHPDVMAVLMLVDGGQQAGDQAWVALEHGATVLAIELARLHGLAETELRLGRNLMSDLVDGSSDDAVTRAQALGHDLHTPHRVVVLANDRRGSSPEEMLLRVREAIGGAPLLMRAEHAVVALMSARIADSPALATIVQAAGAGTRAGVGGVCRRPEDVTRSHREAQLAARLARTAPSRSAVLRYDQLGVYQLLAESADPRVLDGFVRKWLGALIEYDRSHTTDLVGTLAAFLESGGNYDATGLALTIGRSTVRYRVRRIEELSDHDLGDPETRFQLQLAIRAWGTLRAL